MFQRHKAAKEKAAERRQAVEELRAMAARLPDADGAVSVEGFQRFFQFAVDHDINLNTISDDWRTIRLGLAHSGYFLQTTTTLLLHKDETALLEASATLLKEVTDREFRGGSRGVSIPIGGGVRYRVGAMRGHMVTIGTHWAPADTGALTVTEQRIVYHGGRKTVEFPFAKLATLNVYRDAIDLGVTSRQATSSSLIGDPQLVAGMIHEAVNHRDNRVTVIKLTADH